MNQKNSRQQDGNPIRGDQVEVQSLGGDAQSLLWSSKCGSLRMLSRLGTGVRAWFPTLRCVSTQATAADYFDPCSDPKNPKDLSLSQIKEAYERIKGKVACTDCNRSHYFSKIAGCDVYLKMENKQLRV
ncbi:hypothetical protein Y032_0002g549 [Ancylostoma ceylanicum]|uniref:Uncharacterized protein n=1 Tax=Ancylostoma ceylanicum TaxID=53326 RepID=A0A016W154_9BILA|nr:hypothetical protein Y032_0002g549 [Ancylostoma ceylanicum]